MKSDDEIVIARTCCKTDFSKINSKYRKSFLSRYRMKFRMRSGNEAAAWYSYISVVAGHAGCAGCGADDGKSDASDHLPVMTLFQIPVL